MRSWLRQLARSKGVAGAVGAAMLAAAASWLWPASARAQGVDDFGAYGQRADTGASESPQDMALEVRFGRYVPEVDSEFDGGATPYEDTFGNDNRYLLGFELDWQLLRIPKFGTLGPGFGWGYTTISGDALLAGGGGRSDQETSLSIMPMYVAAVLRVDVLARDTPVPLVPYGKGGFGYALWWASDPDGVARDDDGVRGRGSSYGLQFALGGMLLLDSLDRGAAIEMDNTTGVNNSYFFVEWYFSNLDCFGGDCMQVGANTWMLGLALEF